MTCPDEVLIDLQSNRSAGAANAADPASGVHIVTSRLSFSRETGMATSDEAVQFRFPEGEGRAIGLSYDSQRGELHLLRDVEVVFRTAGEAQPAEPSSEVPTTIASGGLVYRRDERLIHLSGPAVLRRGAQELHAGQMALELDDEMRARRLIAREGPVLHNPSADSDISLSADELEALLEKAGRPERVVASRNVVLNTLRPEGRHELTADSATLDLIADSQQPRHFAASGNVIVHSTLQDHSMRQLQTSRLDLDFVSAGENDSRIDRATAEAATMEWSYSAGNSSRQGAETMRLKGQLLDGRFDQAGALRELRGSGSVEVQKRAPGDAPMTSRSRELVALIAPDGAWSTVDQTGDVRLENASGVAQGDRARFDRAADSVTLTGSVVLADASSQTRAQSAVFRQNANELRAEGNVATSELSKGGSTTAAGEPAHISSANMVADTVGGRAIYSGKARLWQGDSIIQADTIELDRARRILIATGNVNAIFPESRPAGGPGQGSAAKPASDPSRPGFVATQAGRMVYEEDQPSRPARPGRLCPLCGWLHTCRPHGPVLRPQNGRRPGSRPVPPAIRRLDALLQGQEVQRAQGFGAVRIESAGRIATAERADYTAAESKIILSGGSPKLNDEFGNSTAGRQLTFFFSDDRIIVDSEEGSRTLTLHRVEK